MCRASFRTLTTASFVLLSSVMFVSCSRDHFTDLPIVFQVSGVVVDSVDGTSIAMAKVTIDDSLTSNKVFTSDSSGVYLAVLETTGKHELICRKSGYLTKVIMLEITGQEFNLDSVSFALMKK